MGWPVPRSPASAGHPSHGRGRAWVTLLSVSPTLHLCPCLNVQMYTICHSSVSRSRIRSRQSFCLLFWCSGRGLRKMICSPNNTALFVCSHSECQDACCHYPLITTNKLSFNCHKFNQQQSHKSVCYGTPGTQVRDSWWEEGGHDGIDWGLVLTLFCIPHPWALISDIRQWGLVLDHKFMSQLPRVQ